MRVVHYCCRLPSLITAVRAVPFRVGIGYDVHGFADSPPENGHIVLCGVEIAFHRKIKAHSDGDVGTHALVDALLGCVGEGSIGEHFPNTDPRWENMSSTHFLLEAQSKALAKGYAVLNFDLTIVCELPKIIPHVPKMKLFMSKLLSIDASAINIKAVTTEKLGFIGRGEGIAAHAVVLCRKVTAAAPNPGSENPRG
ncbi:2-C-methyl-D-erythritol 2,4-cyclodiphosphate synthase [Anaplasma marginale]|uniref:2-C-methyl-D-erythritol 2,4-cyclodiphosphate synthase n=1 Tax=Anaplasma marginale TaxID=770 RepID=A0A643CKQ1_ANAMA|nr:2-C-methyl-D-erythritol 2,4-cyclodiphosphate synthase [Anaplasma marginale]KAA8473795.1 2-C-methyl-D-erythritol 2,4-cyclodiphosphate synthase [Anaplasma marginale]KAB0451344.1 2-C-methyl-D-erythritol 2,4-cyclodiphosphate synthase [Anaplasma marginale]